MNAEIGCVQMANDIDMSNGEEPVKALLVPGYQRLDFLPTMFGVKLMMRAERAVYGWADQLLENYRGGYWHYYKLSNGGCYLAPGGEDQFTVRVDGNGFSGNVSADAAGIITTLFALGELAGETEGTATGDKMIDAYHRLREFAIEHPEANAILRAID